MSFGNGAAVRYALTLPAALLLAACARNPVPEMYMLDLPLSPAMAGIETGPAVGVGPIGFPQYLDRPQIVTREGINRLNASQSHVWAEPLERSTTRVLVASIGRALESNRVYRLPRRVRSPLDWRIEIDVERFDGAVGDAVTLAAHWSLLRGDDKSPVLNRTAIIDEPVAGAGYDGLITAQTRAIERLGAEIAAAIAAAPE